MARNNNRLRQQKLEAQQQKQKSKGLAHDSSNNGGAANGVRMKNTTAPSNESVRPYRPRTSPLRYAVLAMVTVYFIIKTFHRQLLPHGLPVKMDPSRKEFQSTIDFSNDSLQIKHGRTKHIYERMQEGQPEPPLLVGPETVVFGKDGTLYILSGHGKLVSLTDFKDDNDDGSTITAKTTMVKNLGVGRPLGGKFTSDGKTLYIADAILGLTRIQNIHDPKSKLEVVASTFVDHGDGSSSSRSNINNSTKHEQQIMHFVDDVCIGPKTGKVYFTDASSVSPPFRGFGHQEQQHHETWDCLAASRVDFMRGRKTGRVLEYDPKTDQVKVLAKDIHFANGIAVDKDETYLIFTETFAPRVWKYHLKGNDKKTQLEVVIPGSALVGYPDGVDCSWPTSKAAGGDKCYAVFPSSIIPIHKLLAKLPDSIDVMLRTLLSLLPRFLHPKPIQYGAILEFDPTAGEHRYIQDPTGKDISMLTGVTVHQNKLYLGSIENNYIGVYDLNEPSAK